MEIKITVLCENTVGRLIGTGEHGFSAFIETSQGNYLFDTGNGHSVVANSLALDKDLRSIKKIFLSHGHQDHTGGLPEVLKLRGRWMFMPIPISFWIEFPCLWKRIKKRDDLSEFLTKGVIWNASEPDFYSIRILSRSIKGMFLTGEVPRQTEFEKPDPRLFMEIDGKPSPDTFSDDQSLVLDTEKGLVLVLGCAHSGMINIINHVMNKMKKENFYAILGGTHLDFLTPEQLEASIQSLKKLKVEKIGVSHCTGMRAAFRLHQEFGDRFFQGCVGSVLEI